MCFEEKIKSQKVKNLLGSLEIGIPHNYLKPQQKRLRTKNSKKKGTGGLFDKKE